MNISGEGFFVLMDMLFDVLKLEFCKSTKKMKCQKIQTKVSFLL